jgi:GT2 family glycosyltransferase
MGMSVEVSVIIINYNTPALTEACVRSVLTFTKGCSFEILLVDNASTAGDVSFLAEIDPRVVFLPQTENLGFAKGNNAGWAVAKGAYILLLNSDTELISDAITLSVEQFKLHPRVGALSVALHYPDGRRQYPLGAFPRLSTELLVLTRLEKFLRKEAKVKRYYGDLIDPNQTYYPDWIWGAYWMAPRHVLEKMPNGKLAEDFFMYVEDMLWGWDIRTKQGLDILYTPVATVVHYLSGSEKGGQTEEDKYRKRIFPNERRFLEKAHGKAYAWLFYFVRMLHLITLRRPKDIDKAKWYAKQLF